MSPVIAGPITNADNENIIGVAAFELGRDWHDDPDHGVQ
ncbi:hypothetical protein GFS60_07916 (plasmid) [Rhodococcus sp. WAY2]|nr:hypothetical protein GFS60_07916 [Rhodococcus sp. WAY2]